MTPKSESQYNSTTPSPGHSPREEAGYCNKLTGAIDMLKRDRFELLSAYLDGEVTPAERKQVEDWLANDAEVQCLYTRLLNLRQGLRTLPVPQIQQPVEQRSQQVLARLNHRSQKAVFWGGAAIAALFVGVLSSGVPGLQSPVHQFALQSPKPKVESPEPLMVALNSPPLEIPKAPMAVSKKSLKQLESPQHTSKTKLNY